MTILTGKRDRRAHSGFAALILAACGADVATDVPPDEATDASIPADSSDPRDATDSDAVPSDGSSNIIHDAAIESVSDGALAFDASDGDGSAVDSGGSADSGSITDAAMSIADAGEKPPFDWVGIIGTGQSLAVGAQASAVISASQPFSNGKLVDNGPDPKYPIEGGAPSYAIAPLTEPIRGIPEAGVGQYPLNIAGESPQSGMANEISSLFLGRSTIAYVSLHSAVGWAGHQLLHISKAGDPDGGFVGNAYPASLMETRAFRALALGSGKTFGVGAVVLTHGESDCTLGNTNYQAGVTTLINDYNSDIKTITGQTKNVVLLASQQSTCPGGVNGTAVQLWKAGVANTNIVCTGPKYQFGYANDYLHLPAAGYRRLGEKYGEIFDIVVNQGKAWKPLQPSGAVRTGASIVVTFDVPNPPLQWDETMEAPHQNAFVAWKNGRGFEVKDAASKSIVILSATITSANTVTLALGEAPTGPVTVNYAITQDCTVLTQGACQDPADSGGGRQGGLSSGLRGQLRDSDELIGYDEENLAATVTNGSAVVNLVGSTLVKRAVRDVVSGAGAPANWTIVSIGSAQQMTMSSPWTGTSGAAAFKVHHDLHNYAVHSSLVIP